MNKFKAYFCLGCFAKNLCFGSSLFAESLRAMNAIEIAYNKGWTNLWLETDSTLVMLAFKSSSFVPWNIRNRWKNCIDLTKQMNFIVSHIFREGNCCADSLANIGLSINSLVLMSINSLVWMNDIPSQARADFFRNRLDLPCFRFVNF